MGIKQHRNSKDLTEAEETKKRWQEYTADMYKKGLNGPSVHNGTVTYLEQDILECEVKWALGSITKNKASGGDGIPAELYHILKDVLNSICQQIWKAQQWPQYWKRSVFILIPKKDNAKECSNYHTVALILHARKVMLKILQDRLHQYMKCEFPDVQTGFRKDRGTRDRMANIRWIIKIAREFQKNITSALLIMPNLLPMWITANCGKFFKRWEYQTTLPASWEICMQVKKPQLELDMEQQNASNLG